MTNEDQNQRRHFEILSQNTLKGETYFIKFKDDPTTYKGIPMLRANITFGEDSIFTFNILEPSSKKGVSHKSISDIEFLKKD